MKATLAIATYNVHRFIGRDGRQDPERVAAVVGELEADIVALQEVVLPEGTATEGLVSLPAFEGYQVVTGMTRKRRGLHFGNALLVRAPRLHVRQLDLTIPPLECRGALDVHLDLPGEPMRIVNAHLGLLPRERRLQFARLIEHISLHESPLLAVIGDFNEWRPGSASLRTMERFLGCAMPRLPSFPTARPVFALDRIWVRPAERVLDVRVHKSRLASMASDHFPVVARLQVRG